MNEADPVGFLDCGCGEKKIAVFLQGEDEWNNYRLWASHSGLTNASQGFSVASTNDALIANQFANQIMIHMKRATQMVKGYEACYDYWYKASDLTAKRVLYGS